MEFETDDLLRALGGIGLFLLAVSSMTEGLRALAGDSLRRVLARFTKSPWSGALTGATVTALLRSSTATTVAAVGFVSAGLLTFPQALGITLGANVGTTVTGWIVALLGFEWEVGTIAMPFLLAGALLRLFGRRKVRASGEALAGFALMFVGLDLMQEAMSSLSESVTPESFPDDTLLGRALLVGIGFGVTLVLQSSSAGVAMAMSALHAGAISFPQAAAMVIGMDVGTTVTAALATIGGGAATKRTGYAHVVYNLLTGFVSYWLIGPYSSAFQALFPDALLREPHFALVGFHTSFNLIGALAVLPFAGAFARLMERIVPDRGPALTRLLDPKLLSDIGASVTAAERTSREIAASLFAIAARLAAGGSTDEESEALETSKGAIDELAGYAAQLWSTPEDREWHARHQDVVHVVDHLDRLEERCRRAHVPAAIARDEELRQAGAELQTALLEAGGALERGEPPPVERLDASRRELRDSRQGLRARTMAAAARQELPLDDAIARTDAVRWLHRVAYHAWRIAFHASPIAQRATSASAAENDEA